MALYDEGLQRAGEWVSNYIRNNMLPNLNPNPMMGPRPTTNFDMGVFRGVSPNMNLPAPPPPGPTGQPNIPTGRSTSPQGKPPTTPTQGKSPAMPVPPRPQDEIAMGQLSAVPGYIAKFLVDIGRMALGLPEGEQQPLPIGPTQPQGMGIPSPTGIPSEPSHGYRIAEGGKPEVVNAEGAYFPFEPGQVTPLEPRQEGGEVEPLLGMREYEASGRQMRGLPAMANPPQGMLAYEESGARMRAPTPTPTPIGTTGQPSPIPQPQQGMLPYNERLSRYGSGGLSAYGSPRPDASQTARFAQLGWKNPYESMTRYSQRKFTKDEVPLLPAQGGADLIPSWGITKKDNTYTLPSGEGTMTVGPERFFAGDKEVPMGTPGAVSGDELARQRIYRETPPGGFYSPVTGTVRPELPQRSYYEAHPEERQAEYAMDLLRRIGGKEKFADVYKGISEYGGELGTPHLVETERGPGWAYPPGRGGVPKVVPAGYTPVPRERPKEYEPHSYLKPDGTIGWVKPGEEVPKGWKPYQAPIREELTPGERYEKGLKAIRDTFFELDPIGNITRYTEGKSEKQYLDTLSLYEKNIKKGMAPIEAANDAITKVTPEKITEPPKKMDVSSEEYKRIVKDAKDAIKKGAPADKVKERFKTRTGWELVK